MSENEKKLLTIFGIGGFIVLNFLGFNYAMSFRNRVKADLEGAKQKVVLAETVQENREKLSDEIDWLSENEPEPKASQDVQTGLQQLGEREARSTGLTIKTQKPLPAEATEGAHYHRAKFQFVVTGTEESLYRWFDRLNAPTQLRMASQIRLSPNAQDDTKIDCTATVEQWFIPPTP